MQTIIDKFNKALADEDLFTTWQNEIQLRSEIRTTSLSWESVQIENLEEYNFIKRSLYYGDKPTEFFMILFRNMHKLPILHCVLESTPVFKADLLHHLTNFILHQKPQPNELLFLINMYQEELYSSFAEVIGAMDNEFCAYLLPRTTNKSLRKLIKVRHTQLANAPDSPNSHIEPPRPTNAYPTIYGDKIQVISKAIKLIKDNHSESISSLLDGLEMLFRAGLLTDCLAIMAEMVKYKEGSTVSRLCSEEPYRQQINLLLRKALPIYTLLVNPIEPHQYALDLYRSLFLGYTPDPASLLYLDIYTIAMANLQGYRPYARYELAQKAARILSYRPADLVAQLLQNPSEEVNSADMPKLVTAIIQRIAAVPHEALTIMELLRMWHQQERITFDQEYATALLKQYQQFYYWIPASLFINEQIIQQLGPLTDETTRNAGKLIITATQESTPDKPAPLDFPEQNIFQGNNYLVRKLLLDQFMGVF